MVAYPDWGAGNGNLQVMGLNHGHFVLCPILLSCVVMNKICLSQSPVRSEHRVDSFLVEVKFAQPKTHFLSLHMCK